MAFKQSTNLAGVTPQFEYYLGKDAEAFTLGEALVLDSATSRVSKCGATATPEFICQKTQAAEATAVTKLPVIRVTELQEYEVNVSVATTNLALGSKVTLGSDGASVTDTTSSGVFLVTGNPKGTAANAVGDKVVGYFRR